MALAKRQSQNSKIIGILIGALIIGALGYFAYTRWLSSSSDGNNSNSLGPRGSTINFDKKILDDPRLMNLTPYRISVNTNVTGGQPYPFQ